MRFDVPLVNAILRDAERAADLSLDSDEPIEVDGDACAEVVIAEARSLRILPLREERGASRNDGHHDGAGTRR